MESGKKNIKCSFCGRDKQDTSVLIAGISGHICDHCVTQAQTIVKQEQSEKSNKSLSKNLKLLKPIEIKQHLDEYVIGQEQAKKVLSVAVYNHYKRILYKGPKSGSEEVELEKSNILVVGETGTGKTLLAKTIAKLLHVPFCIADATALTEAGYVGEDVESILARLVQAADYDIPAAERGIVFIDEIDKISRKSDNPSITRDVSGEGVQQALLKLIEGATVNVPPHGGRKHPEQKYLQVNTKNILFICGGAFDGIAKIIARRLNTSTLGFTKVGGGEITDKQNLMQYVTPQDVRSYGLIPELVGRVPVITHLNPLDASALRRILTEPKNSLIKQYISLFEMDNIKLSFEESVFELIVSKALEFKLGARGLRTICEAIMTDAMFELPSLNESEIRITLDYAKEKLNKSSVNKLKAA